MELQSLTKSQQDFWKTIDYNHVADYQALAPGYYSGPVHNYTSWTDGHSVQGDDVGMFWFWYYTDMEGRPVEQGEGGCVAPRYCNLQDTRQRYVWHEYNVSSITLTSFEWDDFKEPDICEHAEPTCYVGTQGEYPSYTFFCNLWDPPH